MHDTITILKRLFGEEWKTLMLLSAVTALCCLPVVTAGPALLAMHGVLTRLADGRCGLDRFREYREIFRAKLWRGVLLEAVWALYLAAMAWCVALSDALETGASVLLLSVLPSLFLAGLVSVYWVPLLGDTTLSIRQALWNAVCLAFLRFPRSLLAVAAVSGLLYVFLLLYLISVLPFALFALAATAALSVAIVWPAINELLFSGGDTGA